MLNFRRFLAMTTDCSVYDPCRVPVVEALTRIRVEIQRAIKHKGSIMNDPAEVRYASKNMTSGELNALVKMVGGEQIARDILASRRTITVSDPIRIEWSERRGVICFDLISNGFTGPDWIKHLEGKGCLLVPEAKDVLNSGNFVPTPKGTVHKMRVIRGSSFITVPTCETILARAKELMFSGTHPETACLICDMFSKEELRNLQ